MESSPDPGKPSYPHLKLDTFLLPRLSWAHSKVHDRVFSKCPGLPQLCLFMRFHPHFRSFPDPLLSNLRLPPSSLHYNRWSDSPECVRCYLPWRIQPTIQPGWSLKEKHLSQFYEKKNIWKPRQITLCVYGILPSVAIVTNFSRLSHPSLYCCNENIARGPRISSPLL